MKIKGKYGLKKRKRYYDFNHVARERIGKKKCEKNEDTRKEVVDEEEQEDKEEEKEKEKGGLKGGKRREEEEEQVVEATEIPTSTV